MREAGLPPDRVGTKSVNKRAAARRGGAGMALGEAADSRAKVSSLFRFRVFPQSFNGLGTLANKPPDGVDPVRNCTSQHSGNFTLCYIEPTAMPGRVMAFKSFRQPADFGRRERRCRAFAGIYKIAVGTVTRFARQGNPHFAKELFTKLIQT